MWCVKRVADVVLGAVGVGVGMGVVAVVVVEVLVVVVVVVVVEISGSNLLRRLPLLPRHSQSQEQSGVESVEGS